MSTRCSPGQGRSNLQAGGDPAPGGLAKAATWQRPCSMQRRLPLVETPPSPQAGQAGRHGGQRPQRGGAAADLRQHSKLGHAHQAACEVHGTHAAVACVDHSWQLVQHCMPTISCRCPAAVPCCSPVMEAALFLRPSAMLSTLSAAA